MNILKALLLALLLLLPFGCDNISAPGGSTVPAYDDPESPEYIPPTEIPYLVGCGIQDITGPAAEVMFAGYCDFEQLGNGIFMRQWARAFIIKDRRTGKNIVMAVADIPLMSSGVYAEVIDRLKKKYGDVYNEKNVAISATHTHSGPGGYFRTYALNIFAGMTFHQGNFDTIVDGVYEAIAKAHENLQPGRVFFNSGEFSPDRFKRISRQRSEEAYVLNRDAEEYLLPNGDLDDTNRTLSQLRLVSHDGTEIGMYNWAPIHPNVSGSHLKLINGDISGYASYLIESNRGTDYAESDGFVAAFAYNDAADTSGNLPEDAIVFNNDGDPGNDVALDGVEDYIADGPNDHARVAMRARTAVALAEKVFAESGTELTGQIDSRQVFAAAQAMAIDPAYINEEDVYYEDELGEGKDSCRLCNGAAGVGFFAGSTEDGDSGQVNAGEGNPREIDDYSIANLADLISDPIPAITDILLHTLVPSSDLYEEMDCQLEKRMTLNFDELDRLIPGGKAWNMNQPFQIHRIGDLAIITLPAEVTTMSGRRIKKQLKKALPEITNVVINSTSNCDLRYLTTREEYAAQQYEGGATLMGPYSLNAFLQIVSELAATFKPGAAVPSYAVSYQTFKDGLEEYAVLKIAGNVVFDDAPVGKKFGSVRTQPEDSYKKGSTASAVFWGAHPNNNLTVKSHESFLVVERKNTAGSWEPVARDWDPCTRYIWKRNSVAFSLVTIEWDIPAGTASGIYRIRHIGQRKSKWTGKIYRYEGVTEEFLVN